MARRYDHTRDELTQLAIEAATEVVRREGVQKLSVRKIATQIGYSPGTLYNVFDNMEDLVVQVAGNVLDALYDYAAPRMTETDPREALYQLAEIYMSFIEENPNLWELVVEYRLPDPEFMPPWYLAKVARLYTLIEKTLAPLYAESDAQNRHLSAVVLWAAMQGLISLAAREKIGIAKTGSILSLIKRLVDPFITGLEAGARN